MGIFLGRKPGKGRESESENGKQKTVSCPEIGLHITFAAESSPRLSECFITSCQARLGALIVTVYLRRVPAACFDSGPMEIAPETSAVKGSRACLSYNELLIV